MKKQIVQISKLQTAKVAAVMYFIISLPMAIFAQIPMWMSHGQLGVPWVMIMMMPILYTLFGFVFTFIGAWIYNGVAARTGGIEFTTAEVAEG